MTVDAGAERLPWPEGWRSARRRSDWPDLLGFLLVVVVLLGSVLLVLLVLAGLVRLPAILGVAPEVWVPALVSGPVPWLAGTGLVLLVVVAPIAGVPASACPEVRDVIRTRDGLREAGLIFGYRRRGRGRALARLLGLACLIGAGLTVAVSVPAGLVVVATAVLAAVVVAVLGFMTRGPPSYVALTGTRFIQVEDGGETVVAWERVRAVHAASAAGVRSVVLSATPGDGPRPTVPVARLAVPPERLYWACVAFRDPDRRAAILAGGPIAGPITGRTAGRSAGPTADAEPPAASPAGAPGSATGWRAADAREGWSRRLPERGVSAGRALGGVVGAIAALAVAAVLAVVLTIVVDGRDADEVIGNVEAAARVLALDATALALAGAGLLAFLLVPFLHGLVGDVRERRGSTTGPDGRTARALVLPGRGTRHVTAALIAISYVLVTAAAVRLLGLGGPVVGVLVAPGVLVLMAPIAAAALAVAGRGERLLLDGEGLSWRSWGATVRVRWDDVVDVRPVERAPRGRRRGGPTPYVGVVLHDAARLRDGRWWRSVTEIVGSPEEDLGVTLAIVAGALAVHPPRALDLVTAFRDPDRREALLDGTELAAPPS